MKHSTYSLYLFLLIILPSCVSTKKINYIQDVQNNSKEAIQESYEIKIHKDDLLSIIVNGENESLVSPFNIIKTSVGENIVSGYIVDVEGNIDFPFLGKVKVEGLTRLELASFIKEALIGKNYIKEPIVTVNLLNYKISVLGEVARPGTFSIYSERITILEALSLAGDLTIYGKRDKVHVVRESNGERFTYTLDLRKASIFSSPVYYLQQNDVVYVEPNKSRASQSVYSSTLPVLLSGASVLTSILFFILK